MAFVKGQSGNPKGRPPKVDRLKEKDRSKDFAASKALELMERLYTLAMDDNTPPQVATNAATKVIEWGIGKVATEIALDPNADHSALSVLSSLGGLFTGKPIPAMVVEPEPLPSPTAGQEGSAPPLPSSHHPEPS